MKNGLIIGTIACMVAIILVGSVLAPVINTTTTTTIKVDNDGAVGLRMEKITTGNFTITFDEVDGEFTATNGSDAQIIDDVCIFYADNNLAVWLDDTSVRMVGVDADDKTFNAVLSDSAAITITKSSEGVNITDGTVDKTFPVPSWSFVPKSTGAYGFFLNETEVNTAGMDTLFVGSFAGVDCYNGINTYDLPIVLDKTASGSTLSGAKWIKAAAEPEELNPDDLHIIPLEPSINPIVPDPDVTVMVATPTYTEGDWGYDLITTGYDTTVAAVVSYSGNYGSNINPTIPSTIGGYEVKEVGQGGTSSATSMFQSSWLGNVTIPEGVVKINDYAFYNSGLISVELPNSLLSIGKAAFQKTTHLEIDFHIPENVTFIGNSAFSESKIKSINIPAGITEIPYQCFFKNNLTTAYIPDNITSLGTNAYSSAQNLRNVIVAGTVSLGTNVFINNNIAQCFNLGDTELTTSDLGAGAEIRQGDSAYIDALGYLAVAQYSDTVRDDSPMAAMFAVIPLIMVIAILMFAVGFTIYRKME